MRFQQVKRKKKKKRSFILVSLKVASTWTCFINSFHFNAHRSFCFTYVHSLLFFFIYAFELTRIIFRTELLFCYSQREKERESDCAINLQSVYKYVGWDEMRLAFPIYLFVFYFVYFFYKDSQIVNSIIKIRKEIHILDEKL